MLKIIRTNKLHDRTLGELFIDDEKVCDTLEDTDRGLDNTMALSEIEAIKIKGKTAIPIGMYYLTLDVVSNKYSHSPFMLKNANGARVPRLLDVKGFDGILIHCGNGPEDTQGCVLVGERKDNSLINSKETFIKLYQRLQSIENPILQVI